MCVLDILFRWPVWNRKQSFIREMTQIPSRGSCRLTAAFTNALDPRDVTIENVHVEDTSSWERWNVVRRYRNKRACSYRLESPRLMICRRRKVMFSGRFSEIKRHVAPLWIAVIQARLVFRNFTTTAVRALSVPFHSAICSYTCIVI